MYHKMQMTEDKLKYLQEINKNRHEIKKGIEM